MSNPTSNNSVEPVHNFFQDISNYIETDTRGFGIESTLKNNKEANVNYIEIPTPAWFPDSFLRSLKRNNYFNMLNSAAYIGNKNSIDAANSDKTSLDFYKESNTGIIQGLAKSAVKSIVSTAANQVMSVTSKVDSVINGIKSLVSSSDENASLLAAIESVEKEPFIMSQPYLNIYGIHLTESLRDAISSLNTIINTVSMTMNSKVWDNIKDKNFSSMANSVKSVKEIFSDMYDKTLNATKKFLGYDTPSNFEQLIYEIFKDKNKRLHSLSELLLKCSVSGTYTMKCRVPYFGNTNVPIMKSCGENGFGGITMQSRRSEAYKSIEAVRHMTGFNMVWSNPLDWSPSQLDSFTPVDMQFDIFNDTIEHVLLNLSFIWSFGATAKAVTDTIFIRPPFIYNIEIPAGFRYRYCKCVLQIIPKGKIRKLSRTSYDAETSAMEQLFKSVFKYDVNDRAIEYVPDYYTVRMSFTSILPDLWNFMDSYLHNAEDNTVTLGTQVQTKAATFLKNFQNALQ